MKSLPHTLAVGASVIGPKCGPIAVVRTIHNKLLQSSGECTVDALPCVRLCAVGTFEGLMS